MGCTGDKRALETLARRSVGSLCWLWGLGSYSDRLLPLCLNTGDPDTSGSCSRAPEAASWIKPLEACSVWSSFNESVEEHVSALSLKLSWLFRILLVLIDWSAEPLLPALNRLGKAGGLGWYGLNPSVFLEGRLCSSQSFWREVTYKVGLWGWMLLAAASCLCGESPNHSRSLSSPYSLILLSYLMPFDFRGIYHRLVKFTQRPFISGCVQVADLC